MIHAISSQWRYGFAPHIEQYLDYVNADLAYPPNQQRATAAAPNGAAVQQQLYNTAAAAVHALAL